MKGIQPINKSGPLILVVVGSVFEQHTGERTWAKLTNVYL